MAEPVRALVVDDEETIRFFLEEALRRVGYEVACAGSGEEALECLRANRSDLVLLDLMLGGRVDGMRVLEAVKWRWPETVVVILTAHGSLDSAMAAVREGVDGYLLKPVEPEELLQVVQEALERRKRLLEPQETVELQILEGDLLRVDLKKQLATLDGKVLELTSSEFELLAYLMQHAYRAVPAPELVRVVRHYDCEHLNEARQIIKWYIHRLRHKVEPDPSHPRYILTVRGVGYRFIA
jgi:DNA-binding response OmpR family regulator